jgi:hypothetical protein
LRDAPVGRRIEVILNERQVTHANGRAVLDCLANLGFVLAEQYLNHNHNPPRKNFVFTRCDTRRRTDERLPFTWSGQWLTPNLHGNLPAINFDGIVGDYYQGLYGTERIDVTGIVFGGPVDITRPIVFEDGTPARIIEVSRVGRNFRAAPVTGIERRRVGERAVNTNIPWFTIRSGGYDGNETAYLRVANYTPAPVLEVGATVQITNPNSRFLNRSGRVQRLTDNNVYVDIGGVVRTLLRTSVRVVTTVAAAPAPAIAPAPREPQRHEQGEPPVVANRAAPPPPPPVVRVIHTTWHNRYQDGRIGAGYDSLAGCEGAAPRCRTRIRREISSDGSVNDVVL